MEKILIDDILKFKFISNVKAVPEGKTVAFTVSESDPDNNSYKSGIWLYENGQVRRLTSGDHESLFFWEDATHILFPAVRGDDKKRVQNNEKFTAFYRIDIHGGEAQKAFEVPVQCGIMQKIDRDNWFFVASVDEKYPDEFKMSGEEKEKLAAERKKNEDYHIFDKSQYRFNGEGFVEGQVGVLFIYNVAENKLTRLTNPDINVIDATLFDRKIMYFSLKNLKIPHDFTEVYSYDTESKKTEVIYNHDDNCVYRILNVNGKAIVPATYYKYHGLGENSWFYELKAGEFRLIAEHDDDMASSVGSDCRLGGGQYIKAYGDKVYFTSTVGGNSVLKCLDGDGKITTVSSSTGSIDSFDITGDGDIFVCGMYSMLPGELYSLGNVGNITEPVKLTDLNMEVLKDKYIAKPEHINVESAGENIDGWILKPIDYDENREYPAVLDIHGGPKTAYGEVFYHEMQVWASRGYFVFFCNPFGSDGKGGRFADIRGKYGTTDYKNIMDFTDEVLKLYPQINKNKVAVTGGSYGGFMTNWIVGHTDRFACAATQRSISDWFSFYGASDIGIIFANDQTAASVFTDPEKMWDASPLKYVKNVTTPTLFIHSDEDYRCPIDQGLQFYTALLEKGVDTRFVWFKGENHELSRSGKPAHRIKRLTEITDWIEKYTR